MQKRLKLLNIDTGATYRCVTLAMLKQNVKLEDIEKFLQLIRRVTKDKLEVLLLGGEPTVLPTETLINIAKI